MEASWRLIGRVYEQVASALVERLPSGDDSLPALLAEAKQHQTGWAVGWWHWTSEDILELASTELLACEPAGDQLGPSRRPAWLLNVLSGADAVERAVVVAGAAFPGMPDAAAGEAEQQQQQQHLAVARALKPLRCAHLGCTNAAGSSEADLPSRLCSACRQVRYCSAECAAAAWRKHRPACKLLQQQA